MNYSEAQKAIKQSSHEDWIHNVEHGSHTYKHDLNLRIQENETNMRFTAKWANEHPDSDAYKVKYEIYYGNSLIETKILVSVDGGRAILPIPKRNTNQVDRDSYHFAEITNPVNLEEYMEASGLVVVP